MQIFTTPIMFRDDEQAIWVHKFRGHDVQISIWARGGTVVVELRSFLDNDNTVTQILLSTNEARDIGAQLIARCIR